MLDEKINKLVRPRKIAVSFNGQRREWYGVVLWSNPTHVVINCGNGRRIFLLRSKLDELVETPIT